MSLAKSIHKVRVLNCSPSDLWKKWTTSEGIGSFLSKNNLIEARPGGAFEIYFLIENEKGLRGSEGCKFLALDENNFLSFTWNAPPLYPHIRKQNTVVTLHFRDLGNNRTELELNHYGWGQSGSWRQVYEYFENAWEQVLENLEHSLPVQREISL